MPSKKITTSKKSARQDTTYKRPRPISTVAGGGFQGGLMSSHGTGTDR
jgi:hypothetical protein